MTYRELWQSLAAVAGRREAQAVVRLLLGDMFGLDLADIITFDSGSLAVADQLRLSEAMKRLRRGEPVQYVLGHETFCGRSFEVSPAVLIPRPETETLVALAEELPGGKVLDVGTGSGCIAISVKLDGPETAVSAWDVSAEALAVARGNAKRLGAEVDFRLQDALCPPADNGVWDVIVSNPPYVRESEKAGMEQNVLKYEPEQALFVPDSDPLRFYTAIGSYALLALRSGGRLLFECNTALVEDVARLLSDKGLQEVSIVADQFGRPRFVTSIKP